MQAQTVKKVASLRAIVVFSLVLIFGIVFLGFFLFAKKEIPADYVKADATIVRIEEEKAPGYDESDGIGPDDYTYSVFVDYSYNGKTYTDRPYGNYNSSMKAGDTVVLYLNPADPETFMSDPSDNFVFLLIGIGILLVGAGGLGYSIYKKRKEA